MNAAKRPPEAASGISDVIALIDRAERRLLTVLEELPADGPIARIAEALQDLTAARVVLEVPAPEDNRASPRVHERSMICLRPAGAKEPTIEAEVYDISAGGALIRCDAPLEDGMLYDVEVDGLPGPVSARVRAANANLFHIIFERLPTDQKLAFSKHLERHYFRF